MFPVKSIDKREMLAGCQTCALPQRSYVPAQLAVFTNRPIYGDKEWKEGRHLYGFAVSP